MTYLQSYNANTESRQGSLFPSGRPSTRSFETMPKRKISLSLNDSEPFVTLDDALDKAEELASILHRLGVGLTLAG